MLYQTHMHGTTVKRYFSLDGDRGKKAAGEEKEDGWRDGANVCVREHPRCPERWTKRS